MKSVVITQAENGYTIQAEGWLFVAADSATALQITLECFEPDKRIGPVFYRRTAEALDALQKENPEALEKLEMALISGSLDEILAATSRSN
jgi:hypothetical protein